MKSSIKKIAVFIFTLMLASLWADITDTITLPPGFHIEIYAAGIKSARAMDFGPDGKLYIPIGAPCNVCLPAGPFYESLVRVNLDGTHPETVARGIRNTVGFDWHPQTAELWFTDNGRDLLGDDRPPDELNRISFTGEHFGFPFVHGTDIKDPEFGASLGAIKITPPVYELPAHAAALGMRFYSASQFPDVYRQGVFIAEHGSWNRSHKIGYRVSFVKLRGNQAVEYQIFAAGWLKDEKYSGRPADVQVGPGGSLYVSDDFADIVYRIYFQH